MLASASALSFIATGSHFLVWASSLVVVGITAFFLNNYAHDSHLTYEMVISSVTAAFWIPSLFLPFLANAAAYKKFYIPLNGVFSYLWLTAFVFAAQDYNKGSCWANAPSVGHCSLKLASESFIFLAMFFHIVAMVAETVAWRQAAKCEGGCPVGEKNVRGSEDSDAAVAPAPATV
ncbi:hypothetical protein BU24DRAFT_412446 [Aaosphaeria arxii CBS 175.79]|uniref:MARVEL domain-containing protein n=1 Tax=Aaosphaeria arxii CBS 175.79 TaxID=1450172 RepID=A0A6A5XF78_9PLEO|nr:uncharacterized protein BU24DRAFT_412446 [Aaosphaeria arxii CBS 175.79]KAF2011895.1 hypothetical protein BU24DRAFT_412446 [Aaosphaeria arxii CBS 175.79]